ncbi:MAG: T9SS type A sorting domain-containing protein [Bacteroidales bacterium]
MEIPGKTTATAIFTLSAENQSVSNVNFVINGNTIALAVDNQIAVFDYISNIYPNPANKEAGIDFTVRNTAKFDVNIYNQTGQLQSAKTLSFAAGNHKIQLDIQKLPIGLYTVKIISDSGDQMNRKLIIRK